MRCTQRMCDPNALQTLVDQAFLASQNGATVPILADAASVPGMKGTKIDTVADASKPVSNLNGFGTFDTFSGSFSATDAAPGSLPVGSTDVATGPLPFGSSSFGRAAPGMPPFGANGDRRPGVPPPFSSFLPGVAGMPFTDSEPTSNINKNTVTSASSVMIPAMANTNSPFEPLPKDVKIEFVSELPAANGGIPVV